MKKLIAILLFLLIGLSILSCKTPKHTTFETYYFYKETKDPQLTVDSLSNAYKLEMNNYTDFPIKRMYWTSDNCIDTLFTFNDYKGDTLFVTTVTTDKTKIYTIKFRFEHR